MLALDANSALARAVGAADAAAAEALLRDVTVARRYAGFSLAVGGWHPDARGAPPVIFRAAHVPPAVLATDPSFSARPQARPCRGGEGWSSWVEQLVPGRPHVWSNNAPATDWDKCAWLRRAMCRTLALAEVGRGAGEQERAPAATASRSSAVEPNAGEGSIDIALPPHLISVEIVRAPTDAKAPVAALPDCTHRLLRRLVALLNTTADASTVDDTTADASTADASTADASTADASTADAQRGRGGCAGASPLPAWQEAHLRRGPFVPLHPRWPEHGGTRSQTVIVADRTSRTTWYGYRETDAGKVQGGAGPLHALRVFGVPWPRHADGAGEGSA
jgi:hypothetical protein